MVWYSHLSDFPQFTVIHTVKGFGIVNKAEIDVFLELSCFFHDPADVGNFISGSSAFSKTSLNIWKFTVQVLLMSGMENFKHYFTIKIIPMEKKCKKAKWLSGEALQIAVKQREVKSKGEKERYKHLNAEFQRIARRDKKAFFSDQCKE